MPITENYYFFQNHFGDQLYGSITKPLDDLSPIGVLLVPAVGHERIRCYRECVTLARDIAASGFAVFRFDYRGEGESDLNFEESNMETRLQDIQAAMGEFRAQTGLEKFCLLGFRLGAVLCLMSAKQHNCKHIILCDPVVDMNKFVCDLLRAHIILQKHYLKNTQTRTEDIIKTIESGKPVSVYGFHISNSYIKELEQLNPLEYVSNFDGNASIIKFLKANVPDVPIQLKNWHEQMNRNGVCQYIPHTTTFSWSTKKIWTDKISGLSKKIINLLSSLPAG